MKLPEFSVKRPVTVTMMILIIVVLGGIALSRLGLDMLPDITYPLVSVITEYSGVAPEDIEELVTKPLEETISRVKNIKSVSSTSQEGLSIVMCELEWGTNLDFAAQDMRDNIGFIQDFLPDDITDPLIVKFDISAMPVSAYAITANLSQSDLKNYFTDNVKPKLERLDGVAQAWVVGGYDKEIIININADELKARHLSLQEVTQSLSSENLNLPAGHITKGDTELLLRTTAQYQNLSEIENTIVALRNNTPIYLKDIAEVAMTHKEIRSYQRANKKSGLMLAVMKESGANTVQVHNRVEEALEEIKQKLPFKAEFSSLFRQGEIIKDVISRTAYNALWGGILAVLILFIFLRNWRPTLIISIAIPLSIMVTFVAIYFAKYTLNIMTLGALALGIGMLVDNAIVVIESIFRKMEEGYKAVEASITGTSEVGMAITASTLTTMAVFLPLVFSSGIAGKLSQGMALTIAFALFSSLFVALTMVPMFASKALKGFEIREIKEDNNKWLRKIGKWIDNLRERYKKVLHWVLTHRAKTVLIALAILIISLLLIPFIGTEFMPASDSSIFFMMAKMPVGTTLERTNTVLSQVEDIFLTQPEVLVVGSQIGLSAESKMDAAFGFGARGVNEGTVYARLIDKEDRTRSSQEIISAIRKQLPEVKGVKWSLSDMGSMMTNPTGEQNPIAIKVFGKDLERLKVLSEEIASIISTVDGVYDVDTSLRQGKPELQIKLDRERASNLGISAGMLAQTVQTAVQGRVATIYRKAGEEIDIRVQFQPSYRQNVEDIKNYSITSASGRQVQLKQIANISYDLGPVEITRENQERKATVTANISGRDLGSITRDIQRKLASLQLPTGYFYEIGGEYEDMVEMLTSLAQALALAILLVYMVMAAQFESLIHPFVIMFSLPFALVGVILGFLISGKTLSTPSFLGIIMLAGIVVNNAIVMIDYINQLRRRGMEKMEAIIQGASIRMRPILITSFTTIFGMLPMAFSQSEGAEMRAPMAIAVVGGLFTSMILTLLIIPTIYSLLDEYFGKKKRTAKA
jgi:HAE1 family hydrophobic/amphiphilic exporter-1